MAKNRIRACWLLLLTAIFTASTVMGTGQAQARYQNTVTWNTVVDQTIDADQVSSDCLENTSNPPVTVLLGGLMGPPMDVVFYLYSGVPVIGPLNWTSDRPDYVDVTMSIGTGENLQILQPGDNVEIPEGANGLKVTMTLTPTDKALGQSHGAMDINVEVVWSDCLQGTFLTFLPELDLSGLPPLYPEDVDPEETLPSDPTEPVETEPSEPTDPAEPEQTQPTEPTQPEETQPTEPSQPVEPAEANENEQNQPTEPPAGNQAEAAEDETNPDPETLNQPRTLNTAVSLRLVAAEAPAERENRTLLENGDTQPSGEESPGEIPNGEGSDDSGTSGESAGNTGDGTTGDDPAGEEPSQETEPRPVPPEVRIETLQAFKSDNVLPVKVVTQGPMSTVELGMGFRDKGDEGMEPIHFPKYMRYSLDGGQRYYMLYNPGTIALTPTGGAELFILLDFSRVELSGNQLDLAIAGYEDTKTVAAHKITTTAQKQYAVSAGSRILTPSEPLEIIIPQSWQGYVLEYEVRVLTSPQLADGTYGPQTYEIVELSEDGLFGELTETGNLQLQLGKNLPQAGCYQISLIWKSGETVAEEAQVLFYINYSVNKEILKTGGAEQ